VDDVVIEVKVHPGARRTGFAGLHDGAWKIDVAAPAVDGRANEALVEFLAQQYGVRRSAVAVVTGASARRKRVRIEAPTRDPHAS
jgi:uncharacterized protein (TIGR00251 family)